MRMLKSFKNEAAQAAWDRRFIKRVPQEVLRIGNRKLLQLHNARLLSDLKAPPGNRLEALTGDRLGQHSIRINDQWRVVFRWDGNAPHDVRVMDYHRG